MMHPISDFWKPHSVPTSAGCYLYYNEIAEVIYVGKAKNLRIRMRQYFQNTRHVYRTQKLVAEITFYNFYQTNNEKEALILEQTLIKKYKPKYNLLLKDDKAYPYLIIPKSPNPHYTLVRNNRIQKYYRCYGPFPDGAKAQQFLHFLQQNLPLSRCLPKQKKTKPCFYAQINQCLGPCYRDVPFDLYSQQMKKLDKFFRGEKKVLYEIIDEKIATTARNLQFEEAIKYRDLKQKMAWIMTEQNVALQKFWNIDVIALAEVNKEHILLSIFNYRNGLLINESFYYLWQDLESIESATIYYLNDWYEHQAQPTTILLDNLCNIQHFRNIWPNLKVRPAYFVWEKKLFASIYLLQKQWLRTNQQSIMLTQKYASFVTKLQTYTDTTKEISTIDMFDVSNLVQTYQVGACTVFHETKPQFKSFRKFIIPSHLTNDSERTYFLVKKRYASLQKEKQTITTDLLIMDGGIMQIKAARKALAELNLTLPIIGLVKNNYHQTETLMNERQETFALTKTSLFYLWLANMQTITHEQAIKYHHKRKQQGDLVDPLLTVPGISIRLSELLYQHFPRLELLQKADFTEINKIVRNKATTNRLLQFLKTKLM